MALIDQITIGAMADSAFEYFLKQYLMTNQTEQQSLDIYLRTMRGIMDHNMFLSPTRSFVYVTDVSAKSGMPSRRFEHLSCFLPGLLALGAARIPPKDFAPFSEIAEPGMPPSEYERHVWAAAGLAIGCATTYEDMPTGLGADEVLITTLTDLEREWQRQDRKKQLEGNRIHGNRAREASPNPEPAPPMLPGSLRVRPLQAPLHVNQSLEDIKLRWGNVIDAWRAGHFDGFNHEYVGINGIENDGHVFGNMWKSGPRNADRIGPVPGLRDPPLPPWDDGDLGRDYRPKSPSYQLRPEVRISCASTRLLWNVSESLTIIP